MMKKTGMMTSALALVMGANMIGAAAAQEQEQEDAGRFIEEVIVTAQKREQSAQDIPISITTLSSDELSVFGSAGQDVRFLSNRVPSLQIESSFGRTFPRFYIRGLGNSDFDLNASQPVSLVYDDVVLENPILKGFPVFDLDRVEVLNGPQGTLFGRNTPAGIIKFESRKPTEETDGYFKANYGRFNTVNLEGALGGKLVDGVSSRISLLYQRRDNYVNNAAPGFEEDDAFEGYDEFAGRLQFLIEPTDNFSALLNVHGRYLEGTARVFRANIVEPGTDNVTQLVPGTGSIVGAPFALSVVDPDVIDFQRDTVFLDGQNDQTLNTIGGLAKFEYVLDGVGNGLTVTSVTSYESAGITTVGDIDGGQGSLVVNSLELIGVVPPGVAPIVGPGTIPFDAQTQDALSAHRQITTEFRVASNEWGRVDFQAGFYYFDEELTIDTTNFDTLGGNTLNGFSTQTQESRSFAFFGNVDIELLPTLTLAGGFRYTDDERDFVAERPIPLFFNPDDPIIPPSFASTDADPVAWDVSLTYQATEDVNVFARIARSFRAPSIQGRVLFAAVDTTTPETFAATNGISVADTETIISYEAGVKSQFFNDRVRFNLTGYFFEVDDQQLTAVGGLTNIAELVNADRVEGVGFEAQLEAVITQNLFFTSGISFNNTEIDDPNLAVATCGAPCTPLDPVAVVGPDGELVAGTTTATSGELAIIDGNPLVQAPEWVINGTLNYVRPLAGGEFNWLTDFAYRSRVNFFLYESEEFTDGGLFELGMRFGWKKAIGGVDYEFAAFGRNILNDVSRTGGIDFNNLTGFVNEPPIWGVEVVANF